MYYCSSAGSARPLGRRHAPAAAVFRAAPPSGTAPGSTWTDLSGRLGASGVVVMASKGASEWLTGRLAGVGQMVLSSCIATSVVGLLPFPYVRPGPDASLGS
jgi:hypothetical protein